MKKVVNASQMKQIDSYTIHKVGIPSMVLMERAAFAVCECVKDHIQNKDKILAICGVGNNGGDGIAAARILHLQNYHVDILIIGNMDKASKETKQQINIASNLGISIYNNINLNEYTIIIDAIFGIGLNQVVKGQYKDYIDEINSGQYTVFSVDIPSGLSADTGKPLNEAVRADYTITFGYNKIGMILYPGCEYTGEITVADIGFPAIADKEVNVSFFAYDGMDKVKLPIRRNDSNKGSYGKVLIIAGSVNMNGACYLASKAAYRVGAGLVKVLIPEENRIIMQTMLPEAVLSTYNGENQFTTAEINNIIEDISLATSIVIGPGIGTGKKSEEILDLVLKNAKVPVIIDADGINILAQKIHGMQKNNESDRDTKQNPIKILKDILPKNTILTPHLKELSRLIKVDVVDIKKDFIKIADYCTDENNITFVLKDARTIVAQNALRYINTSGNNGMSTGGSGDVLSGIIAGLIAGGLESCDAAIRGVYIHGLSGDIVAKEKGKHGLIASDMIDALAKI